MKDALKTAIRSIDGTTLAITATAIALVVSNICDTVVAGDKSLKITGPCNLSLEIK